jgi:tetratricopeptide (TPR) repeat protein
MAKRARPKTGRPHPKMRRPDTASRRTATKGVPVAAKPALAPAPPEIPDAQAVKLFQQALEYLHGRQYAAAAEGFRALLDRFPGERALLDRSRVYLELAERELNRRDVTPRTIEERVTAATAAMNNDHDVEAERLVRSVLADDPRHELALYLMAALEARRGDHDAAVTFLSRAISVSPEVRAQARLDSDFDPLRRLESFQALIDVPPQSNRRGRRLR